VARSRALPSLGNLSFAALLSRLPLFAIVLGALGLIVAEFLTLREIRTITAVPRGGTVTGGANHAYALAVIGVALLPMGFGAVVRGARPAAIACLVLGAAAAFVVLAIDLPHINDPGLFAETYELAQARPVAGFYVESCATALVLVGAVAALMLGRPAKPARRQPAIEGQERH
jgi:hypothetical protein